MLKLKINKLLALAMGNTNEKYHRRPGNPGDPGTRRGCDHSDGVVTHIIMGQKQNSGQDKYFCQVKIA